MASATTTTTKNRDKKRRTRVGALMSASPCARGFVCSVRQDGLQVYIRTWTPAYEQDRVGFRGTRLRPQIRLLMCLLQREPSWKFVACSSSALWLRSVGHGYCERKFGSADTVTGNDVA